MPFQLSDTVNKEKVFLVRRSELEGRIDPSFNLARKRNLINSVYPKFNLGKLCRSLTGGTPSKSNPDFWTGVIPWVSPKDFKQFYIEDSTDHITEEAIQDSSTQLIPENSVLIVVRSGVLIHTIPIAVTTKSVTINQDIKALLFCELVLPAYAAYYIYIFQKLILPLITKHSTTVQSVNTEQFERLNLIVPPLSIQEMVIAKMDSALAVKKQKEAQAQQLLGSIDTYLLNELGIELPPEDEDTIGQRMFVRKFSEVNGGRLDPFFHIPYLVRLDNLFKSKAGASLRHYANSYASGATPSKDESDIHYTTADKGIPFIRVQNLSITGELQLTDLVYITHETHNGMLNRSKVFEGDLLVKITGVGRMAVASIAPEGFVGNINQHVVVIRTGSKEVSRWLATFINLDSVEKIASKRATGGTRPALDYPALFSLPIIFPPLEKQNEIAAHIQTIRDQAKQLRAEAAAGLEQAKREVESMILGEGVES
jgi:restriction endonuclease S subunit